MATLYEIHPKNPQARTVDIVRDALKQGAIMLYPTDTVYAIGCDLNSKPALKRVRQLKQLANDKPLTFLCESLSNIASYARISDPAYRTMKHLIPGPYTFLLPATKAVPKLVMNPKRRTSGIRVPDSPLCHALISALGNPVISTSAFSVAHQPTDDELQTLPKQVLFDRMDALVDIIIDDEADMGYRVSTILDMTANSPTVVRQGQGWEEAIAWGADLADEL